MSRERFNIEKGLFENLCRRFGVPVPKIGMKRSEDPCDFTSAKEVRLDCDSSLDPQRRVEHNFGHYLADLHGGDEDYSDVVADVIAGLVETDRVFVRGQ